MSRFSRAKKVHGQTVEGRRAVLESLRAGRDIERLLMVEDSDLGLQLQEIVMLASEKGIEVEAVSRKELEAQSQTKKSQGVIAVVPDPRYHDPEELMLGAETGDQPPLLVMLDGIQDPHNLGAIARTADAAGAHGLIIPERRAVGITAGAVRASAGALEHVKVSRVGNLNRTIERLKELGMLVIGLDADGDVEYTEADFTGPVVLVVGSEGKGLSRLVRENCDQIASIPMAGQLSSLNASVSAGIVLYEACRQRAGK
ncbi:MAG TPA: 23S rRNA (guanosine(2251)-2'-O)-methyltransferase RlmB [Dehalococcoidia bacterium]|nr:23S rRNA (guanosine(2251)-2'-O)-methyltransferase RlmB [Dehalococcoidia bacterium]HIK90203.1 23S rRNA (guanosine(2251)-2'-O)-methyltransferase RlmB [Dehalococcoidia bacterium]